jgi:ubiquinone/menaquinone biosynthesis C-methylase UbiE
MSTGEGIWSGIGHQLKRPSGRAGWLTGCLMTVINREPNRLAIEALRIQPEDTVLELGFGPGSAIRTAAKAASRGLVLGVDASPEMLAQAARKNRRAIGEKRVQLRLGTFGALPWLAGSIDKILAVNVAYFFSREGDEVREARRVLKPGGLLAIYATHRETMQHWKFSGPDTHTLYDETELSALLLRGGFCQEEVLIRRAKLAFGIQGILVLARKNGAG